MSVRFINPATVHPAPGYSHVAESRGGRTVHFAGQVALDPEFRIVGDNIHEQTVAAMNNLKAVMDELSIGWEDIVRRTIYTLHPTEYEIISRAIDEVTGGADNPPQTIVGVTGLAVPGLLIEIECTAVAEG
jgi:enamine deaminase RidA (YjgF/YER057c/UK114 family)